MHTIHSRLLDCSAIDSLECSGRILTALGHGPDFALMAESATSTVHGSVTIEHNLPPEEHGIIVEIYEQDNDPTGGRQSILRRPAVMPTEATLQARLDTLE